ncbi:uncharacterized protein METZ01_LOCUS60733 [marine metagenome]|uniref:Uncharacterized protein n=1 Tax=marine metagenome TaxID=408172 RepID=A0A381SWP8_9ZZZZ
MAFVRSNLVTNATGLKNEEIFSFGTGRLS